MIIRRFSLPWAIILCTLSVAIGHSSLANDNPPGQKPKEKKMITAGALVSLEYTLNDEKGVKIESNVGSEGLQYVHGKGQIVPGLEKALQGMKIGETKEVKVSPEEGYGPVDKEAFIEVPKDKIPEEALKVGSMLQTAGQDGRPLNAMVSEIKDTVVILNFNHPFAGKTLYFEVKILGITEPEAQTN